MKNLAAISICAPLSALLCGVALGAPVTYTIDPGHTYPSFEADHNGGMSFWRGKFNESSGQLIFDKAAKTGTVEVTINTASLDFGHDRMNEHAKTAADLFDVAKYPTAVYKGTLAKFVGDAPTEVVGELTLHGVTKPVTLKISQFMCKSVRNADACGADATTTLNRFDYGITNGQQAGFKPEVTLRIQVEARAAQPAPAP